MAWHGSCIFGKGTTVIICTAATQKIKEIDGQLKQLGVKLVNKPFEIDTLLEVVRGVLSSETNYRSAEARS